MFHAETTSDAYLTILRAVLEAGQRVSPRGDPCLELCDVGMTVRSPKADPIVTADAERNAVIARYTAREFELYDSCTNSAARFAKGAKLWDLIKNPDGTVNSAYGFLIHANRSCGRSKHAKHGPMTPWEWAKLSLMRDRDSRQAFLRFSLPSHQWFGNKDQPCTMHGWFCIRQETLHLTVVMRSNDLVKGLAYDMPWFCSLIPRMRDELASHYRLSVGTYTHFAHSAHVYERDLAVARRMIGA